MSHSVTNKSALRSHKPMTRQRLPVAKKSAPTPTIVTKIEVSIEREGVVTRHPLYFDKKDPLTLKEMYNDGFLGDIEFNHPGGIVEYVELIAGPASDFEGDVVGRFAFRLVKPGTKIPVPGKVKKFNFYKR